jgi:23S rRNA (cytidine1920-2'-O)/16S rRNA (cytidine1409-2'-O)-methyltransferase
MRRRLDVELVRRGLAPSRTRAVELIEADHVTVGGAPARTASRQVGAEEAIVVDAPPARFVSRGGEKLDGALEAFGIDVAGRRAIDAGASTGGFTDCLLQRGASGVVAVDVGRGQLAWSLRTDERVTVLERVNVRGLAAADVGGPVDLLVADLSFISLVTVAPALATLTTPDADLVLLVKPQFEAGRDRIGKGGIVRDPLVHRAVLGEVVDGLARSGLGVRAVVVSPLKGADGNVEFLVHVGHGAPTVPVAALDAVVEAVHA